MMDVSDSVLVSSFDPVRREIARISLGALVRDGRIHPANMKQSKLLKMLFSRYGRGHEKAVLRLRLNNVSHGVLTMLGHLNYRLSNNQNTLEHSVEVLIFVPCWLQNWAMM